MFNIFRKSLVDILPQVRGKYQKNVSLSKHTWFGVGGPAEIMYHPADAEDLCRFIKEKPYNLPVCLIGGGSNLLIRDGGVPGVVIKLDSPAFRRITVDGDQITCGAGVKNSELKKIMLEKASAAWNFSAQSPVSSAARLKPMPAVSGRKSKTSSFGPKSSTAAAKSKPSALTTCCFLTAAVIFPTTGLFSR